MAVDSKIWAKETRWKISPNKNLNQPSSVRENILILSWCNEHTALNSSTGKAYISLKPVGVTRVFKTNNRSVLHCKSVRVQAKLSKTSQTLSGQQLHELVFANSQNPTSLAHPGTKPPPNPVHHMGKCLFVRLCWAEEDSNVVRPFWTLKSRGRHITAFNETSYGNEQQWNSQV